MNSRSCRFRHPVLTHVHSITTNKKKKPFHQPQFLVDPKWFRETRFGFRIRLTAAWKVVRKREMMCSELRPRSIQDLLMDRLDLIESEWT
eukprot:g36749.t1